MLSHLMELFMHLRMACENPVRVCVYLKCFTTHTYVDLSERVKMVNRIQPHLGIW